MNTFESPLLGLSQRLPPANLQAEQALLGALLANNKAYERVSDFLIPEHFADPVHGRIFQAIARRVEAGQLADAITLKAEFEHTDALQEVGGIAYLGQLLSAMVGIINAGEYGRTIHDAWMRRQLIEIGETVVNNAFGAEPELDGRKQIELAEETLFALTKDGASGGLMTFERALADRDRGRGARLQAARPCVGPVHRACRPRQENRRTAPVGPADPGWPARHGQNRAGDQDRLRCRPGDFAGCRAERCGAAGPGGDLFPGNERRTARHPPAGRGDPGLRRPHPQAATSVSATSTAS